MTGPHIVSGTGRPTVDLCLEDMHTALERLRLRHGILVRSGFDANDLPSTVALMCFTLLGDHDRGQVMEAAALSWSTLQAKGLVSGALEATATADLRLLVHIAPFVDAIDDLWDRLEAAGRAAGDPPAESLQCPSSVCGLWGQPARIHFSTRDVAHLQIIPDAVFALQPALVTPPSPLMEQWSGSFTIPIDDGMVVVAGITNGGGTFRHRIRVAVGETAP